MYLNVRIRNIGRPQSQCYFTRADRPSEGIARYVLTVRDVSAKRLLSSSGDKLGLDASQWLYLLDLLLTISVTFLSPLSNVPSFVNIRRCFVEMMDCN